jgi:hypothetical protein
VSFSHRLADRDSRTLMRPVDRYFSPPTLSFPYSFECFFKKKKKSRRSIIREKENETRGHLLFTRESRPFVCDSSRVSARRFRRDDVERARKNVVATEEGVKSKDRQRESITTKSLSIY